MAMTPEYMDYLEDQIEIAPANSQEELQAAQTIAEVMRQHGLDPQMDEFEASAGYNVVPSVLLVVAFAGLLLAGLGDNGLMLIGFVLLAVVVALFVLKGTGNDLIAKLGGKARSQNVVAVHRATGPLVEKGNRPIVVVAHYDTPHESFLYSSPISGALTSLYKYSPILMLVVVVTAIFQALGFVPEVARKVIWVIGLVVCVPLVILGIGGIAEAFQPCTVGSNDNKSGVAAMLGVLENVRPTGVAPISTRGRLERANRNAPKPEPEPEPEPDMMPEPEAQPVSQPSVQPQVRQAVQVVRVPVPVEGVRHGEDVMRELGILPEDCQIEYVQDYTQVERLVPVPQPAPAPTTEPEPELEPEPERTEPHPSVVSAIKGFFSRHSRPRYDAEEEEVAPEAPATPVEAPVIADEPTAPQSPIEMAAAEDEGEETFPEKPGGTLSMAPIEPFIPASDWGESGDTGTASLRFVDDDEDVDEGADATAPQNAPEPAAPSRRERNMADVPQIEPGPRLDVDQSYDNSNVARRATLFDLPDPTQAALDPFAAEAEGPGHEARMPQPVAETPVQPAPEPVAEPAADVVPARRPARPRPTPEPAPQPEPQPVPEPVPAGEPQPLGMLSEDGDYLFPEDTDSDGKKPSRFGFGRKKKDGRGKRGNWKGGAAPRDGLRLVDGEDGAVPSDQELVESVLHMSDDALLAHDIWFVALGASSLGHEGMKTFLAKYRASIRGAFLINLDSIGTGDLTIFTREGLENTRRADRRLVRLLSTTAADLHMELGQATHDWGDTDATPAMRASVRAVTITGLGENGLPALSHTSEDTPENVPTDQANEVAELVTELIRRS